MFAKAMHSTRHLILARIIPMPSRPLFPSMKCSAASAAAEPSPPSSPTAISSPPGRVRRLNRAGLRLPPDQHRQRVARRNIPDKPQDVRAAPVRNSAVMRALGRKACWISNGPLKPTGMRSYAASPAGSRRARPAMPHWRPGPREPNKAESASRWRDCRWAFRRGRRH